MKYKNLLFVGFMVIMIFSLSTVANATTTFSYAVKANDKQNYTFTTVNDLGKKQMYSNFTWNDGTVENVTIKEGSTFTVTICNITGTGVNQEVFGKMTLNGKTTTCDVVSTNNNTIDSTSGFSYQLLNKVASDSSYYKDLANSNSSYKLNGDTFTYTNKTSFLIDLESTISMNIKTGWITELNMTAFLGSIQILSFVITASSSGSSPGFELTTTIGLFVIMAPVVLVYRKKRN